MIDFVMSINYEGVLMRNLEACMQQAIATSPMTIGASSNIDLYIVDGCATTPGINPYKISYDFHENCQEKASLESKENPKNESIWNNPNFKIL